MSIQIDPHTLERAEERGASEGDIKDVISTGFPIVAKRGRTGKARVYKFERYRRGKYYRQKRVEVFYVVKGDDIITVGLRILWRVGVRIWKFNTTQEQTCSTFASTTGNRK